MNTSIYILIPSLNPDDKLIKLIESIRKRIECKVFVVDDGSRDKSIFEILKERSLCTVLSHAVNQGKGRALKTGINYILTEYPECEGIITADSDGQHTVDCIQKTLIALRENPDSLILGSRNFKGQNIPLRSRIGNLITIKVFNFFAGIKLHDTQTGLRGIPKEFMEHLLNVPGEKFEFEMHMLLECKALNIPIKEVFIETVYIEDNKSSHFNPLIDSIKIYFVFFKYVFSSIFTAVIDFVVFYISTKLNISLAWSMINGRLVSSLTNFIVNKKVVFNSDNKLTVEIIKYYLLVVLSGVSTYFLIKILSETLNLLNTINSKIVAESVLFFVNYYIQNKFIFKKANDCFS